MPSILVNTTAAAAGATINPLSTSQYEYLPWDAFVEFAVYSDAGDTWTLSVFSGSDLLMQNAPMPILATATPILYPDHYYLNDAAGAGERLGVQALNGSVGAADFRTAVRITPLG